MSTQERLERLGLAHLSGAALDEALAEQVAQYRREVDAWEKSNTGKAKGGAQINAPPNAASKGAPVKATGRTPETSPPAATAPIDSALEAVRARVTTVLDGVEAATFLTGFAQTTGGSPARAALEVSLAALEEKETLAEQALAQLDALRTRASNAGKATTGKAKKT